MLVEVYTQPNCLPCQGVKRALRKADIRFAERNVQTDELALAEVRRLGYQSTPVVKAVIDGETVHFDGYRPDSIEALVYSIKG